MIKDTNKFMQKEILKLFASLAISYTIIYGASFSLYKSEESNVTIHQSTNGTICINENSITINPEECNLEAKSNNIQRLLQTGALTYIVISSVLYFSKDTRH